MDPEEHELKERAFHSAVREYVVCLLLFMCLYVVSYAVIRRMKQQSVRDDFCGGDAEDVSVYRISVWLCTLSLAVSMGAALLLPISIFTNEVLRLQPNSYYFQWLNSSLVHSLWNYVFLLSNVCLFILLPFVYFFIESQGFTGLRKGIWTRVYESLAVCCLVVIVVCCLTRLMFILWDSDYRSRNESLFNLWNYQLPFLYSCVSLFGVGFLLICTPMGFARLFTVTGDLVVKPKLRREIEDELKAADLQERRLKLELKSVSKCPVINGNCWLSSPPAGLAVNGHGPANDEHHSLSQRTTPGILTNGHFGENLKDMTHGGSPFGRKLSVWIQGQLTDLQNLKRRLERQKRSSFLWLQNLKYPLAMLLLLVLTGTSILMVVNNILQLLIGFRSLPKYKEYMELGHSSLSIFGIYGAAVEIVIIFYLMATSLVGLYSVPLVGRLAATPGQASMTNIIGNCGAVLVLSSALPVLARTLGITTFDLLGNFGRIDWLGNFYLVWFYNLVFAVCTGLCLVTKFTSSVRSELCKRFNEAGQKLRYRNLNSVTLETGHLPSSNVIPSGLIDDEESLPKRCKVD